MNSPRGGQKIVENYDDIRGDVLKDGPCRLTEALDEAKNRKDRGKNKNQQRP